MKTRMELNAEYEEVISEVDRLIAIEVKERKSDTLSKADDDEIAKELSILQEKRTKYIRLIDHLWDDWPLVG